MTKAKCPTCGNNLIYRLDGKYRCLSCDKLFNSDEVEFEEVKKKEYKGRKPAGCVACGGPYPDCRDSCNLFDE